MSFFLNCSYKLSLAAGFYIIMGAATPVYSKPFAREFYFSSNNNMEILWRLKVLELEL